MIINTKYNIDEHVWMMKDNKPLELIVTHVSPAEYIRSDISYVITKLGDHKYGVRLTDEDMKSRRVGDSCHFDVYERDIYPSKRALLESFLDEGD